MSLEFKGNTEFSILEINQGDSGGPMVCYNADGSGYLGGIVRWILKTLKIQKRPSFCSWGIGCGGLFHPGVYTEVAYFVDWVETHTPAAPTSPPEPETTTMAETTMPPTSTELEIDAFMEQLPSTHSRMLA